MYQRVHLAKAARKNSLRQALQTSPSQERRAIALLGLCNWIPRQPAKAKRQDRGDRGRYS